MDIAQNDFHALFVQNLRYFKQISKRVCQKKIKPANKFCSKAALISTLDLLVVERF